MLKLILLCLFWFGLMSIPSDYTTFITLIAAVSLSYFFASMLRIPIYKDYLNFYSLKYFCWLLIEIVKSSISIVKIIISPKINTDSGFAWLASPANSELEQIVYANSIILTPGTLTVRTEKNALLIHFIDKALLHELQGNIMKNKITKIINISAN